MRMTRHGRSRQNLSLQLTSMIDVVFLLLVFFILTFKVVAPEGNFSLAMPRDGI